MPVLGTTNTLTCARLPVFDEHQRRRAGEVLEHISRAVDACTKEAPGLGNGAAGIALFLAYRAAGATTASDAAAWRDQAASILRTAASAAFPEHTPSLFQGLTGVAWALDHLRLHQGLEVGCSPHEELNRMLLEHLSQRPWRGVYELGHGLVGYGVYAAEDIEAPGRREILRAVIDRLAVTALPSSHGGVTWWTAPQNLGEAQRKEAPMGHFNLGLAHGVPSIVAILGLACALRVAEGEARQLALKAMTWLRAQRQPETSGSSFGTILPLGMQRAPRTSRVGWCFGDLGISAALYSAARNMNDAALAADMLALARQTARRAPETCAVKDAGICHGAAGNAHIFNRLYQATHEQEFLDASRHWFERTFDYFDARQGALTPAIATEGDPAADDAEPTSTGWHDHPGIFGLGGIGLALLAAMTPVEPRWDRLLLISTPTALPVTDSRLTVATE